MRPKILKCYAQQISTTTCGEPALSDRDLLLRHPSPYVDFSDLFNMLFCSGEFEAPGRGESAFIENPGGGSLLEGGGVWAHETGAICQLWRTS